MIHWPKGIKAKGEVRHQYHHAIDIVPTILECCGLEFPETLNGHEQVPLPGASMRYSFDAADAPTTKERQYYAMLGTRGIWEKGWKAVTVHGPTSGIGHFDDDNWQLFHTDEDRSEAHDLAAAAPEKLQELIKAWFEEAEKSTCCRSTTGSRTRSSPIRGRSPSRRAEHVHLLPGHGRRARVGRGRTRARGRSRSSPRSSSRAPTPRA